MVKSPRKSVTKKECEDKGKSFRKGYSYVKNGKTIEVKSTCINKAKKSSPKKVNKIKKSSPIASSSVENKKICESQGKKYIKKYSYVRNGKTINVKENCVDKKIKANIPNNPIVNKSPTPKLIKPKSPTPKISSVSSKYDEENIEENYREYIQDEKDVDTYIINNLDKKTTAAGASQFKTDVNNPINPTNIAILQYHYNNDLTRYQRFIDLMKKHKSNNQLYIPSGKYKINRKLKDHFLMDAERYYGKQVSDTLRLIIEMTTYVTFDDFYQSLGKCVESFLKKIGNSPYIFLYLGREDKSNFWVTQLALDYIINKYPQNLPYDILRNYKDVEYVYGEDASKFKYVAFDDCSYSGLQLSDHIEYELDNNPNKNNLYVIVPYISGAAYKIISEADSIGEEYTKNNLIYEYKILKISEILKNQGYSKEFIDNFFKNLLVYLNDFDIGPDKESAEYEDEDWNHNVDNVPIYFDHKIADSVSTYPKLYSFGIIYDKNDHVYVYHWLIKNCINSLNECPPKIYKNREKYIDFDAEKRFFTR